MAGNIEKQPTPERRGRFLSAWKKFNAISAAVLATAGIIFEQPVLLGLAAIDVVQSVLIGKFEKWRDRRKAGKQAGRLTVRSTYA